MQNVSGMQGRRRVFKSGPAEEAIECRRHERVRAREGDYPPSRYGGLGGLPPEKIFKLNFESFSVRFLMGVLCVWDQILVVLVTKIFLVA